jgi:hypothetical protein
VLRLVNHYEEIAHGEIKAAADRWGLSVYPKVRVADVVPIDELGVVGEMKRYGLQSHFDFVVCREQWEPDYAVEFDGSYHSTTAQPLRWHVMPRRIASGAGRPSDPAHQQQLFYAGAWPDVPAVLGHGCLRTSTRLRRPAKLTARSRSTNRSIRFP